MDERVGRKEPDPGVDGETAVGTEMMLGEEASPLPLLAPAVILDLEQHLGGEAIVELGNVDIRKRNAGLRKCLVARASNRKPRELLLTFQIAVHVLAKADAEHLHRRAAQILRPLRGRDDEGER